MRLSLLLLASTLTPSLIGWTQETVGNTVTNSGFAVGDQIDVRMYDLPELGGVIHARVDKNGTIHLPYAGTIGVRGKSVEDLQIDIAEALKAKGIVKDPNVAVEIVLATNMVVQVMGEVRQPHAVPVFGPMPISYVLSQVGGTSTFASRKVTILRNGEDSPKTIDYDANAPSAAALNTIVQPGDVVSVSSRGVFFVAGEVNRPGVYPIGGSLSGSGGNLAASPVETMTLLEALAQVGGITPIAARSQMRILRTANGKREEIKIDEVKLYKGDVADPILMPNDIVYIPSSYIRTVTNNLFTTAISALTASIQVKQF